MGTIDALLAALYVRQNLSILTTDAYFIRMKEVTPLDVWRPGSA